MRRDARLVSDALTRAAAISTPAAFALAAAQDNLAQPGGTRPPGASCPLAIRRLTPYEAAR